MTREFAALVAALLVAATSALPARGAAEPVATAVAGTAEDARRGPPSVLGDFGLRDGRQPISVRADRLEFSYRDRVLTYSGGVTVTQGNLTLVSDVLTVTINESGPDRLERITATGNVEITQGERAASGGRAVFDQKSRQIELTEDAVLREGPNQISGERVVVYLDEQRSVVEGGEKRVQAVLYPDGDLEGLGGDREDAEP